MRSAPFPNGSMSSPSDPTGIFSANEFISSKLSKPVSFFNQEFNIPVPLMHSKTPRLIFSGEWLTCANVFTRESGSYFISSLTPYTTPDVPAVAAISPGLKTFNESALLG